jgi:hypothetical protein
MWHIAETDCDTCATGCTSVQACGWGCSCLHGT